jgi:hypothetical protein
MVHGAVIGSRSWRLDTQKAGKRTDIPGVGRTRRRDDAWNPPATGTDVSALFAVLVAAPLLLPVLWGADQLAFALPLAVLTVALRRCLQAAARSETRRPVWHAFAVATGLAMSGCALALVAAPFGAGATAGFYLAAGGSVGLLVAGALAAARSSSTHSSSAR